MGDTTAVAAAIKSSSTMSREFAVERATDIGADSVVVSGRMASAPAVEFTENTGTRTLALLTLAAAVEVLALGARSGLPMPHSNSYILACLHSVCRDEEAQRPRALDDRLAIHQHHEDRE